ALLLFAQLVAHEVGFLVGRRQAERRDVPGEGIGVLVGGLLGLLAFVLALTLSFASERFSERRAGTLAEANAIGTAWLRAEAIGHPRGAEIARLLEDYARVREEFVRAGRDRAFIDELNRRTTAMQSAIWGHLTAIVRDPPNRVSTSLMPALNEMFDMSTVARFAFNFRLPPQIFWLLLAMTFLGMGALGYQLGLRGQSVRWLVVMLCAMWTLV